MTEISRKERKEAKSTKERHVERQRIYPEHRGHLIFRNLLHEEILRFRFPFYASLRDRQDDDNEKCGAGKAERAERSGLLVMVCSIIHIQPLRG